MNRLSVASLFVAVTVAGVHPAEGQIVRQPAQNHLLSPLGTAACTTADVAAHRRQGDWAAVQTCARQLTCAVLEMQPSECADELERRPVEFVTYVPGTGEAYDVVRVRVFKDNIPVDASLKGQSWMNRTVFRQVFVADRANAILTSRFTTTPETDPRAGEVASAAEQVAKALIGGVGTLSGTGVETMARTEDVVAPPPPQQMADACRGVSGLYYAQDIVAIRQRRATVAISDSIAVPPTCGERYKTVIELGASWRRSVGAAGAQYVESAAAAARNVLNEHPACHTAASTNDCEAALLAAFDTVFGQWDNDGQDIAREADRWVRAQVLGGPKKALIESKVKAAPRDWWSVGVAQAYMFHRQNAANVNVITTDETPSAYKAEPFDHALTMITVNLSLPYDAASVAMSKAERVKLMFALPVMPAIGLGVGLGYYPARAIGVSFGYARLVTKRPTSGAIGEAVRETGNPFTHGWLNTGFVAINLKVG